MNSDKNNLRYINLHTSEIKEEVRKILIESKNTNSLLSLLDLSGLTGLSGLNFDGLNLEETQLNVLSAITALNFTLENLEIPSTSSLNLEETQLNVLSAITALNFTLENLEIPSVSGLNLESSQLNVLSAITALNHTLENLVIPSTSSLNLESSQLNVLSAITALNFTLENLTIPSTSSLNLESTQLNLLSGITAINLHNEKIQTTNSSDFDFELFKTIISADSGNAATIDPYGRDCWYWTNTYTASQSSSNLYWYSNYTSLISELPRLQKEITHSHIDNGCLYAVVSIDKTNNFSVPFLVSGTSPTGTNDHIVGWAHTVRVYLIPNNTKLYQGEKILIHYGNKDLIKHIQPECRRISLNMMASGDNGSSEVIKVFSVNTQSGQTSAGDVAYALHSTGFCDSDTGNIRNYNFVSSNKRLNGLTHQKLEDNNALLAEISGNIQDIEEVLNDIVIDIAENTFKTVETRTLTTATLTTADFNDGLNSGSYSTSINLSNSNVQTIYGTAESDGTGTALIIQFSNDGTNWFNTSNSFFIKSSPDVFSASYNFCIKFIRFIIGDSADLVELTINICYR
jgi:hypothetical protein